MNEERKHRIQALAEAAFDAADRYNHLASASRAGESLEERRRAFVELQVAKAEAVDTRNALDKEVGTLAEAGDIPRRGSKPFEPLLNLNWLEEIFGGGRRK
ncbi:MAG TPA: hypothetical protein VGE12_22850 [Noviherbaspirillum sp.]